MRLGKAHSFTHFAFHKVHMSLGMAMIFLMPFQGVLLPGRKLHFFFLPFLSKSASAFLAPPFPDTKLLTRPIAHAAIGTLREPLDK